MDSHDNSGCHPTATSLGVELPKESPTGDQTVDTEHATTPSGGSEGPPGTTARQAILRVMMMAEFPHHLGRQKL